MGFVVVVKFPCKPGQVETMGDLFRVALSDTGNLRAASASMWC